MLCPRLEAEKSGPQIWKGVRLVDAQLERVRGVALLHPLMRQESLEGIVDRGQLEDQLKFASLRIHPEKGRTDAEILGSKVSSL